MPALGSNSRSNIQSLIYQLVIRLQAYRRDRSVGCKSYAYRHDQLVDGSQAYRRDSCQIQVAVQCERRVVIVVKHRAHLSVSQ